MSQAEALLNSLAGTVIDHKHEVPDSDTHFIIDPFTRQIENTNYQKTVIMRGDHNSERFTFEVPRYVDGHDMSLCNRVIVHFDNVGDSIENIHSDIAYMDDLRIDPDNPDVVISSWLIRREATQIVGILSFSLQYQCIENEEVTYEWNTDSYDEIEVRKSKQNGEAAIIQYTNVLEQWRSQIFGAGDSVMTNITTEGANQVAAVQNESATQQAAIELKGSETLATIPEDYTEVYNMAEEALRTKADGVVCEAEDSAIVIDDASDDYIRGLNVYGKSTQVTTTGKNLFDEQARLGAYNDADGEFVEKSHMLCSTNAIPVTEGTKYYNCNNNTSVLYYFFYDINGLFLSPRYTVGVDEYITAPVGSAYMQFNIASSYGNVYRNDVCVSVDPGDYEPYTGGIASPSPDYPQEINSIENPTVDILGKNQLPQSVRRTENNGITAVWHDDGSVTLNGTATSAAYIAVDTSFSLGNHNYTISGCPAGGSQSTYSLYLAETVNGSTSTAAYDTGNGVTFVGDTNATYSASCRIVSGVTVTNLTFYPQIEIGSEATAYESYKPAQSIALNHTLHGIPVTAGGNYTDENGQQWICDEVDLERGVYVQRICEVILDGKTNMVFKNDEKENCYLYYHKTTNSFEKVGGYSTHFTHMDGYPERVQNTFNMTRSYVIFLCGLGIVSGDNTSSTAQQEFNDWLYAQYESGNPVTFHYALGTPIETPLTAEEIETYKSLKTNYQNTTVLNDSAAWMKVKYNADTKLYIDNTSVNDVVNAVEEVLNDSY